LLKDQAVSYIYFSPETGADALSGSLDRGAIVYQEVGITILQVNP
jgi:hypothetical protein